MIRNKNFILWILAFLPAIVTFIVLPKLPDKVIIQENTSETKYRLFIYTIIFIAMMLIYTLSEFYSQKKLRAWKAEDSDGREFAKLRQNMKNLYVIFVCIMTVMNIVWYLRLYAIYMETFNKSDMENIRLFEIRITLIGLGVMFIVMGNIMPKTHGIKEPVATKWNSAGDEVWLRVNRFTGIAMCVGGLIMAAAPFIVGEFVGVIVMFAVILMIAIVSSLYSQKVYKNGDNE